MGGSMMRKGVRLAENSYIRQITSTTDDIGHVTANVETKHSARNPRANEGQSPAGPNQMSGGLPNPTTRRVGDLGLELMREVLEVTERVVWSFLSENGLEDSKEQTHEISRAVWGSVDMICRVSQCLVPSPPFLFLSSASAGAYAGYLRHGYKYSYPR